MTAIDEKGEVKKGFGDSVNEHDILTGSLPDGRAYTYAEFVELVAAAPGATPGERADAIIAAVQGVAGRPDFDDDCTLLELVIA